MEDNHVLKTVLLMNNKELKRQRDEILKKSHTIKADFGDIILIKHEAFDSPMIGIDIGSGIDLTIETEVRQIKGSFLIGKSVKLSRKK